MLVGRRPLALTFAALASVLAACSAGSGGSGGSDADDTGRSAAARSERDRLPHAESSPSDAGSPSPSDAAKGPNAEVGSGGQQRGPATPLAPRWNTSPSSVAALGDSITRGFDTCGLLSDCPEASWATGTNEGVDSLAMQLLGGGSGHQGDIGERSWNLAETGARVSDLPQQARRAARHEPELVTILIGANDACTSDVASMTSVADFEASFSQAVEVLRLQSPQTQIYVSSVPDLMRLWREGSESFNARMVWSLANICPSMLSDTDDDSPEADDRRRAVRERVRAYNEALSKVCAADRLCRYDGGAVFDYEFTTEHLSRWDWFHPGESGQRQLAALAYEQVVTVAGNE